jgi:hypothetical protein
MSTPDCKRWPRSSGPLRFKIGERRKLTKELTSQAAVSRGSDSDALDDGARWAMVHFVEMAKALVDTVVNAQMENGRE